MTTGTTQTEQKASKVPGGTADKPTQVPAKGWLQIAKRGWAEAKTDNVPLLAAGMAYYAFLAIFPALIAAVLLYGLFADPAQIADQINSLGSALPEQVRQLVTDQLTMASGSGKAGLGAVIAILLALFSASGGVGNMMTAINTAYDEEETRGFVKKRAIALALTLAALVFFLLVITLIAVVPAALQVFGTSGIVWFLIQVVRWVLIIALISAALAVLYRVAPDRDAPKMRWTSVGAAIATVLWIIASVGFSLYVANCSSPPTPSSSAQKSTPNPNSRQSKTPPRDPSNPSVSETRSRPTPFPSPTTGPQATNRTRSRAGTKPRPSGTLRWRWRSPPAARRDGLLKVRAGGHGPATTQASQPVSCRTWRTDSSTVAG
jgi:membrane protein